MRALYILAFTALVLGGCKKDDDTTLVDPIPEEINLSFLEIGQENRYVLLKGEDYLDETNMEYTHTTDTLVIEVISEDETGFLVSERLTPGSASLNGSFDVPFAESTFFYYLINNGDKVTVQSTNERNRSRLFFTEDGDGLPMMWFSEPKVQIMGWKTNLPYVQSYVEAKSENYTFAGKTYEQVNVLVDNRAMRNSGIGHTHIYAVDGSLLRSNRYSAQTGSGYGWDLLAR